MGYDYGLIESLVEEKGMTLDLSIASSLSDAIDMLQDGKVDLIAYEVPITSDYKENVIHCGPTNVTSQVLVQPNKKNSLIRDVTELVGKDIYVEADSKYQQRIENLNNELGGGINIHIVQRDTLITEDLIAMVSNGEIPLTVVDSDIARINKTYFPELDITLEVGFPQRSGWAVAKDHQWLADSIDAWLKADKPRQENATLLKKYFELSKILPGNKSYALNLKSGKVSPYDELFKHYTDGTNIDWRLMAAIGYIESNFNNNVTSWAGAKGIMQIMPATARAYKVAPDALQDPGTSIQLAVQIFQALDKSLSSRISDPKERIKFILASYNAGLGHIYDAIEIAKNTGKDSQLWYGNVEEALTLKSKPEYYNKPYCRNGYFRSAQTTRYVHEVMDLYNSIQKNIS